YMATSTGQMPEHPGMPIVVPSVAVKLATAGATPMRSVRIRVVNGSVPALDCVEKPTSCAGRILRKKRHGLSSAETLSSTALTTHVFSAKATNDSTSNARSDHMIPERLSPFEATVAVSASTAYGVSSM